MTTRSIVQAARRWLVVLLSGLLACVVPAVARAAMCPFNIPAVTLPPHQVGGFSWGQVIRPQNDACVGSIAVEPTSDLGWYVGGINGLYMTKNGGQSWTKPLNGNVGALLLVPGWPQLVAAGVRSFTHLVPARPGSSCGRWPGIPRAA